MHFSKFKLNFLHIGGNEKGIMSCHNVMARPARHTTPQTTTPNLTSKP